MKHDTAGDPMTGLKWTHRTTAKVAGELRHLGLGVGARTVARLLSQMGFALRVNHKKRTRGSPPERDAQFLRIAKLREDFSVRGLPIISVDTKKKELVGDFKNAGVAWTRQPRIVNDHDFRSDALGMAIPWSPPTIMVLIPTTSPAALSSGPPELPGASRASVRMMGISPRRPRVCALPSWLMMPKLAALR